MVVDCQASGLWSDALVVLDQALNQALDSRTRERFELNRLECLKELGLFDQMLRVVESSMAEEATKCGEGRATRHVSRVCSYGILAAWRMGRWSLVEGLWERASKLEGVVPKLDFDASIGGILVSLRKRDRKKFDEGVWQLRSELVRPLVAASFESYQRAYPTMVKLQMLNELEDCWELLCRSPGRAGSSGGREKGEIYRHWRGRILALQKSFKAREPVLSLRVVMLELEGSEEEASEAWMQLSRSARKGERYQLAQYALLKAGRYNELARGIEAAKLLWNCKRETLALLEVRKVIRACSATSQAERGREPDEATNIGYRNKALLLSARWMEENEYSVSTVVEVYGRVTSSSRDAKGSYLHGMYLDKLVTEYKRGMFGDGEATERVSQYWQCVPHVFLMYARSLRSSMVYLDQVLPRILTIWLDVAGAYQDYLLDAKWRKGASLQCDAAGRLKEGYAACKRTMEELLLNLPALNWFAAYPLLVSSSAHRNKDVVEFLIRVLLHTLRHHPDRAAWYLVPMKHSTTKERVGAYRELLRRSRASVGEGRWRNCDLHGYMLSMERLVAMLLEVCNWEIKSNSLSKDGKFSLSQVCPALASLDIPERVMIPARGQPCAAQALPVYLRGFSKDLLVMKSKQKPRRIKMKGDDGMEYPFLCKSGDDLRRDARVMEFNMLVNKLLKKGVEPRKRDLQIRTYSVIPLEEKKGLLSWVLNTRSLKEVVGQMMKLEGKDLKALINKVAYEYYQKENQGSEWVVQYVNKILPLFPSVLWKWFGFQFPEPSSWLRARTRHTRTTAVMCMVGAVLGLGDRHCENIMLDVETGDCVHVDLNCIFYQGLELKVPEIVPFRLTHNIVDSFGVTGYNGAFRRACELTISTLRTNKNALMSVLEAAIHDPLLSRERPPASRKKTPATIHEMHNREILEILDNVSGRIDGLRPSPYIKEESLLPLSIEGHVDTLIKEATSIERLCKLYIGWNPFI
ncbi:uncharacterized protein LOC126313372 [Schistocerca gregaria]|uniref:uncharacterized protein LOC126313372 n=1 Tax=Schistocerca gregaria TaxID=7010 RepID=UPI00211E0D31|nr:uncharacterized protein LOC126313372 [Schistocerca gregaria]